MDAAFHLDHVIARQHLDAEPDVSKLALACDRCNFYKGTNLSSVDPITEEIVPVFNPRKDSWLFHFRKDGVRVVGLTPSGRATVRLLQMNAKHRVELRRRLIERGGW